MQRMSVEQLSSLTDYALISIYRMLNYWQWPEDLGDKPEGWDEMPNYRKPYMDECKTKEEVIRPYMKAISARISIQQIYPQSVISKSKFTL